MTLTELGLDDWVEQQAAPLLQPGHRLARVTAVDRGAFLVRTVEAETPAELAGKFRFAAKTTLDMPCVGDWVCVQSHASGGPAMIQSLVPRKTILRRKSPGEDVEYQIIAANLDVAFIVQACGQDFNLARLDRYLVMANEGAIEPWIVLTKTDLIEPDALATLIEQIETTRLSAQVLALSNTTGAGLNAFRQLLVPGRTYCLMGSSGVGKTTLINRLIGNDAFETRAVSDTGEGVHTTSRRQLVILDQGAMLIDTPGMRELGLLATNDGIEDTFSEILTFADHCRFTDCTHTEEPGCAVRQAVKNGDLSEGRRLSYLKLKKESKFHQLSYAERRKKDRSFGRFIKSVKKNIKP